MPKTIKKQEEHTQKDKMDAFSPDALDSAALNKIRSDKILKKQTHRYNLYSIVTPTLRAGIMSSVTQVSPPQSPIDEEKPNKNFTPF